MKYSRFKSEFLVYALLWLLIKPLAAIAAVGLAFETLDMQARRLAADISESKGKLMLLMLAGWTGSIVSACTVVFLFAIGMPETAGIAALWVLAIPTMAIFAFYFTLVHKYASEQIAKLGKYID